MKKTVSFIAVCLLAIGTLCACNKQNPDDPGNDVPDKPFEPITLTKAEREINTASNQFGFDVYHKIYAGNNILISPLSLSLALSMATNGAEGKTAEEMLSTLGFAGQAKDDMNSYYQKMISALLEADPKTTFEVANSIWANESIGIKKSFTDVTKKYFSSEVYPADFSEQATVDRINKWCSDKTHGKIPTILDGPDPDLVMALINALYFKGTWAFDFDEKVKKEDFTTLSGSKSKVEMMTAQRESYAEYDGYGMVSLPYGNGAFTMDVILPPKDEDFAKAVARFDASTFMALAASSRPAKVNLKLPKFTFDYTTTLNDALQALGIKAAFNGSDADFSAMAEKPLMISMVKQKTFIDVNEKGTEAAAVTFIGFVTTAYRPEEPPTVDFFVDRPFLFVIREISTGAVLFMGQKVS